MEDQRYLGLSKKEWVFLLVMASPYFVIFMVILWIGIKG